MPLPRFDHLDAEQKARMLAAAQSEFAEHGYEKASLTRIATAAGISKGTLYYYFADRDDLYATIVLQLVETVASTVTSGFAPRRAEEFWPALEALCRAGFELAKAHPVEVRALRSFQVSLRRNPSPVFEPILRLMTAQLRGIVETGRRLGCVRKDISVDVLVQFLQAADEVLDRSLYDALEEERSLARHAALAFDTFRRLMESQGEAPQKNRARR